ncbi:MAG: hypothetical protein M3R65_12285 [Gemmatimonadota bacterium]|nr:hypothetical protein [Gemmatimonadota bacterium]
MSDNREWFLAGLAGGLIAGLATWSGAQHAYRRDLFSRHSVRRLAALGHLSGQSTVATAHLLREYIAWETRPILRGRAVRQLKHLERALA